jgi:hypothetical protein
MAVGVERLHIAAHSVVLRVSSQMEFHIRHHSLAAAQPQHTERLFEFLKFLREPLPLRLPVDNEYATPAPTERSAAEFTRSAALARWAVFTRSHMHHISTFQGRQFSPLPQFPARPYLPNYGVCWRIDTIPSYPLERASERGVCPCRSGKFTFAPASTSALSVSVCRGPPSPRTIDSMSAVQPRLLI